MVGTNVVRWLTAGLVVAALASAQQVQAQGRRGGGMFGQQGVSPLTVAASPAVQKELKVKPEQQEKLSDLARDVTDERRDQLSGAGLNFQGLRDLSREERQKRMAEIQSKMAEINKAVNAKFMPVLEKILDKDQLVRLKEIAVQAAGPEALHDPDVVKELNITKEQQDKLHKIAEEYRTKQRELFGGGTDQQEARTKLAELRTEQTAKSVEVLTKEQQAQFTKMKGKEFDVSQIRPAGRRRNRNN